MKLPSQGFIRVSLSPKYKEHEPTVKGTVTLEYQPPLHRKKKKGDGAEPEELFGPLRASVVLQGRLVTSVVYLKGKGITQRTRRENEDRVLFTRRAVVHDGPITMRALTPIEYSFDVAYPTETDDKAKGTALERLPPSLSQEYKSRYTHYGVEVTYQLFVEAEMPGIDVRILTNVPKAKSLLTYHPLNQQPPTDTNLSKNSGVYVQSYSTWINSMTSQNQQRRGTSDLLSGLKEDSRFSFSLLITSFTTNLRVGQPITFRLSALAHPEASTTTMVPEVHLKKCHVICDALTNIYTRQTGQNVPTERPLWDIMDLSPVEATGPLVLGGSGSDAQEVWIRTKPIQNVLGTFQMDNIRRHYRARVEVEMTVLNERVKMLCCIPVFLQDRPPATPGEDNTPADRPEHVEENRFAGWTKQQIDELHDELEAVKEDYGNPPLPSSSRGVHSLAGSIAGLVIGLAS